MMNLTYAIALLSLSGAASAGFLRTQQEHIVPTPMHSYKGDCGQKVSFPIIHSAAMMLQQDNVPGAGIDTIYNADKFKPFTTALKDGYVMVSCVKDYMYNRGDKYGKNKLHYKLGPVSRVSIVHYEAFIRKEDRVKITPRVCFEFCRTVPNMGFFGITNGDSCYCTPYFTAMESDSSQCDMACEGDGEPGCGGKTKSAIYTMHMCASTQQDLLASVEKTRALGMAIHHLHASDLVKQMEGSANDMQKRFGKVGDGAMSDLAQQAKVIAGKVDHGAERADRIMLKLEASAKEALTLEKEIAKLDTLPSSMAVQAEHLMEQIDESVADGEDAFYELQRMVAMVNPQPLFASDQSAFRGYYPVMHFIDTLLDGMDDPKTKRDGLSVPGVPTTCSGDLIGMPLKENREACAAACDENLAKGCIGFQHVSYKINHETLSRVEMCFLFSGFKTGFYYTKCGGKQTNNQVGCWAKKSRFEGPDSLKPDPKGKCKTCFKKFIKADRCY